MKLTVIGQWGGYPKAGEASTGYLLEANGFKLLIDCGSGVLSHLQHHIEATELDAVLLSHYHPDHVADIGVLQHALLIQYFLGKNEGTLPVYAHREDQQGFNSLTYKDLMTAHEYTEDSSLSVGPFTVTFVKSKHPVPCYGMRIEADGKSLFYTADSAFREEFISFGQDADVLLCECNFYGDMDASNAGHMTSLDAGKLAQKTGARNLILTHLPHFGDLEQLITEAKTVYSGHVSLAKKDMVVEI
ncbi:MBL fold metallo-hydrolase [Rossellomorea vietnamensis]|uniref:MBL fold metallo-hydrolase n=1 Tax=Rossellomorea vietnamensis TaxID=218284 RepID=A0ACD4CAX0_9BACI|nr:MBL fold metallo-hydrolase [Rossellomorea vietnamensis]UXH45824.1 MBL fold metallo-hydrolase [Rossellomorea vietnamensis]WQI97207.1 MBL fold metallo-hydrolase [Rossellomorea vietnamensis]